MKLHRFSLLVLFVFVFFPLASQAQPTVAQRTAISSADTSATLHNSSVLFIENVGQFDQAVRFKVWGASSELFLTQDALWFVVREKAEPPEGVLSGADLRLRERESEAQPRQSVALKLSFSGADPRPRLEPFERLETSVNYFIGNDPGRWRTDVPVWGGVRYKGLYPGIDLEVAVEGGRLVPRLVAQPGADLGAVRLRVEGADAIELLPSPVGRGAGGEGLLPSPVGRGAGGEGLLLNTAVGEFTLPLLQVVSADGSPLPLSGDRTVVQGDEIVAPFAAANLPLRFAAQTNAASDLLYSTFLGGSNKDESWDIAVDGSGAVYVTGETWSFDFPATQGSFQTTYRSRDVFVTKLNASGTGLLYSTFLGGGKTEQGSGIVVDDSGAAYVIGGTDSSNFPTTEGAFQTTYGGGVVDAFVAKLNAEGSGLLYATFLGGSDWDLGWGIAVDRSGAAYVTGDTYSSDFPTTPGAFQTTGGGVFRDGFVAKYNAEGSDLLYSTYLGGRYDDFGKSIVVDGDGAAYVTGNTYSFDFPITARSFQTTYGGNVDAFVAKYNAEGSDLLYSTFLGGGDWDVVHNIVVDGNGATYVVGGTDSSNFPTMGRAFQTTYGGNTDAFVAKLNANGTRLLYSTFLGGGEYDFGSSIMVDEIGAALVTGLTGSDDFPIIAGAFQTTYGGGDTDVFVVKLGCGRQQRQRSALFYFSRRGR